MPTDPMILRPERARTFRMALASALVVAVSVLGLPQSAHAQGARLVKKSGEWSLYAHDGSGQPICFLTAGAKETEPKGGNRKSYFYVAAWPKEGVKSEVSVNLGTALKDQSPAQVSIGNTRFSLFTKDDKAFVGDAAEELKLIDAMKKGSFMVVQATSGTGASIKDTYSLIGVTQGITDLATGCK